MHDGIDRGHPDDRIDRDADHRQPDIDDEQLPRDVGGTRQGLAKGVKTFGAKELHAAHPHQRQKDHRDERDPQAAQPVQHAPPQVHPDRQRLQPEDHRGPSGGDARDGLEIRILQA